MEGTLPWINGRLMSRANVMVKLFFANLVTSTSIVSTLKKGQLKSSKDIIA